MTNEEYVPVEKLLGASNGSIYKLTVLAAKRAMELANGEKSLVDKPSERPLDGALQEIAEKKISVKGKKK